MRFARRGRWNEQGWVMATVDGRAMSPDTISSSGTRFVKMRKLPPLTLHGLRHPYAADLFENALDGGKESMLKIVQERLGHADPGDHRPDLPTRDRAGERQGEVRAGALHRRCDCLRGANGGN